MDTDLRVYSHQDDCRIGMAHANAHYHCSLQYKYLGDLQAAARSVDEVGEDEHRGAVKVILPPLFLLLLDDATPS